MGMERHGFDSRPEFEVVSCPPFHSGSFDGSQNWIIAQERVVAGSSPASGSRCRGSSVVERVYFQFVLYPSYLFCASAFDGPKLWVIACYWFDSSGRLNMPT